MTLEEKIAHLQETVMTEARSEGNAIIDNHKKALESFLCFSNKDSSAFLRSLTITKKRLNLYLKSIKKKRPHSLRSVSNPRP